MDDSRYRILGKYNRPRSCTSCNSMNLSYNGLGEYKCDSCGTIIFDDYGLVRNYVEQNRSATVSEISLMTGVAQSEINEMLRDEKFEITVDSRVFLECKACGKPIRSGVYCETCSKLADAARMKKIREEEKKAHQQNMSGVAISQKAESGAKRFSKSK